LKKLIFLAVFLAACQPTEPVVLPIIGELPEGFPPRMGTLSGTLGDDAVAWETFDFSIGAYDASASVYRDGAITQVWIAAMLPDMPDSAKFRLTINAQSAEDWTTAGIPVGALPGPIAVTITRGGKNDAARMTAETATLVIDTSTPPPEIGYKLGHITGTLTAQMCATGWPGRDCAPLVLRLDTDVQFGI